MGSYTVLKNQQLAVNLPEDFSIQGWIVSEGIAYHSGCNSGYIKYSMDLSSFSSWTFKYKLGPIISGGVNIVVGGVNGIVRTIAGEYEETFDISGPNVTVQFYSDGINSVEFLKTYPLIPLNDGVSLVFNEDENGWGGEHSYNPEYMHKFIDSFFSFKDGRLWEHDVNEIRNNFYGVQYTSKLKFVANDRPQFNKLYFGIKIHSNGQWSVPEMITPASETYPNGMKSRLHENNFTLDNGKYWADILRDTLDPQFNNQLQALFEGRVIEGNMLIIELESKSIKEVKLNAVYIYSADQDRNF